MREQIKELAGIVSVLVRDLQAAANGPDWMDRELLKLSTRLNDLIDGLESDEDGET